jgi:hypothetical protein
LIGLAMFSHSIAFFSCLRVDIFVTFS